MHLQFVIASMLLLLTAAAEENSCSLPFCSSCTNKGPQCLECATDKVLNNDKTKCLDCPENCVTCINDDKDNVKCETCSDSYYKTTDEDCEKCMDNCDTCTDDSSCDQCTAGFSFSEEDKECKGCAKGEYKEASGSCASCPNHATDCALVGETVRVTSCTVPYVVNVDTADATKSGTKCLACLSKCTKCNGEVKTGSTSKCTACQAYLYLVDDECMSCTNDGEGNDAKCVDCSAEGKCSKCKESYMAKSDGECEDCPSKCLKCKLDDSDVKKCSTCEKEYGVNGGKTCDSCPSNCDVCTMNSGVMECTTCKAGFEKNAEGVCNSCPANCNDCHWHVAPASHYDCDTCATGYVANKVDGTQHTCDACPTTCKTCSYVSATVVSPVVICDTCITGHDTVDNAAANQPLCRPIPTNCATLVEDTPSTTDALVDCATCVSGYKLDALDPIRCSIVCEANCIACDSTTVCTGCIDGYSVDSADCVSCIATTAGATANCKTCTFALVDTVNTATCTACIDGYIFEAAACYKCPSNCDTCVYDTSEAVCSTCATGYAKVYSGTSPTGKCSKCPASCTTCSGDKDGITCDAGQCQGKTAVGDDGLCQDCPEHCSACSDTAFVCSACDDGYGKDDNDECLECPANCETCTPNGDGEMVCDTCSVTYGPNTDDCASCSANCDECAYDKGTMKCGECAPKYAKGSAGCENCPANCDECSSATKCNNGKCTAGYAKDTSGACVLCSSLTFEKCILCTDHPGSNSNDTSDCTKCQSGYVLKDGLTKGEGAECKDVNSLDCGTKPIADLPPQCAADSCTGETYLDGDFVCVRQCYVCGELSTNSFVAPDDCKTNNDSSAAKIVECKIGKCYGEQKSENDKVIGVMMGCLPVATTCTEDMKESTRLCKGTTTADTCKRCCDDTNRCNNWPKTEWNGAGHITASVLLIAVFLITNIF